MEESISDWLGFQDFLQLIDLKKVQAFRNSKEGIMTYGRSDDNHMSVFGLYRGAGLPNNFAIEPHQFSQMQNLFGHIKKLEVKKGVLHVFFDRGHIARWPVWTELPRGIDEYSYLSDPTFIPKEPRVIYRDDPVALTKRMTEDILLSGRPFRSGTVGATIATSGGISKIHIIGRIRGEDTTVPLGTPRSQSFEFYFNKEFFDFFKAIVLSSRGVRLMKRDTESLVSDV